MFIAPNIIASWLNPLNELFMINYSIKKGAEYEAEIESKCAITRNTLILIECTNLNCARQAFLTGLAENDHYLKEYASLLKETANKFNSRNTNTSNPLHSQIRKNALLAEALTYIGGLAIAAAGTSILGPIAGVIGALSSASAIKSCNEIYTGILSGQAVQATEAAAALTAATKQLSTLNCTQTLWQLFDDTTKTNDANMPPPSDGVLQLQLLDKLIEHDRYQEYLRIDRILHNEFIRSLNNEIEYRSLIVKLRACLLDSLSLDLNNSLQWLRMQLLDHATDKLNIPVGSHRHRVIAKFYDETLAPEIENRIIKPKLLLINKFSSDLKDLSQKICPHKNSKEILSRLKRKTINNKIAKGAITLIKAAVVIAAAAALIIPAAHIAAGAIPIVISVLSIYYVYKSRNKSINDKKKITDKNKISKFFGLFNSDPNKRPQKRLVQQQIISQFHAADTNETANEKEPTSLLQALNPPATSRPLAGLTPSQAI